MAACGLGLAQVWTMPVRQARQQTFVLQPKTHICIIGNTLGERMQRDGWLEAMFQARFPKHELVFRNLAFSGDEMATRLRSKNFGTPDEWLSGLAQPVGGYEDNRLAGTNTRADVVFAFFGYNESYAGQAGLDAFKKTLGDWLAHTLGPEVQRQVHSARRPLLPYCARGSRQSGPAEREGEQPAARALHQSNGRGCARRRKSPSSIYSRPA